MAPAGPLSVCRSRTPTFHRARWRRFIRKWCFGYPVNYRALFCMHGSVNTREEERHRQGGCDPVGVRPPDVQSEARTSSWSVASVGPPAASGLSLGDAYVAASAATSAHLRCQSLVHFSAMAQPQEDEPLNHISSSSSARAERYDTFVARLRPAPEGLEAGCAEVREELGVQLGLPCVASVGAAAPFSICISSGAPPAEICLGVHRIRDVCKSLALWRDNVKSAEVSVQALAVCNLKRSVISA